MDVEKYNREIGAVCPTCGATHFKFDQGVDETIEMVECASCGRKMTKDELLNENSENISEHINEIGKEIVDDLAKDFKRSLQKALRGNKYIKIK